MSPLLEDRGILCQPIPAAFPASGLIGRLRADSIAQADGSAVATWPGLVGGDATQATSGNQPTYRTSGINSKPSVEFVKANSKWMSWALTAVTAPCSALIVFRTPTTWPGPQTNYYILGSSIDGGFYVSYDSLNKQLILGKQGVADSLIINTPKLVNASNYALLATFDPGSTANQAMYLNAATATLATNAANALSGTGTTALGARPPNPSAWYLEGQIAEVCKWNKVLNSTERSQVFAYTLAQYGV